MDVLDINIESRSLRNSTPKKMTFRDDASFAVRYVGHCSGGKAVRAPARYGFLLAYGKLQDRHTPIETWLRTAVDYFHCRTKLYTYSMYDFAFRESTPLPVQFDWKRCKNGGVVRLRHKDEQIPITKLQGFLSTRLATDP
ncbi:hypothetical protein EVAR_66555_1 [Eumeta japonica]|uniref:Uncharacterized protein n=1 Tax=Eumeta variegata TaxID=151549 RepID=A0A4C1ZFN4_EUMVA|nr:hypothetical protein EVAR_66555_1 [Eumeta japonica]